MYFLSLIVIYFVPLTAGLILDGGTTKYMLKTETLVRRHGYPFEKHTVQTEDGYILELHRIPYSVQSDEARSPVGVAFLMHGLLCSSSDWVVGGPKNSLAFMLSDAGYDVWLGNSRGNTYSRNHIKYSADGLFNADFWNFSWHEMGIYDLPAMMDYTLSLTGKDQLKYFAHSQGTTSFFVLNSLKPEYGTKFKSAHLLAPVAYMSNSNNTFLDFGGPLVGNIKLLQVLFGATEFRPTKAVSLVLGNTLCTDFSEYRILCNNPMFLVTGFTNETVDKAIIPDVMASTPAGMSTNQGIHYIQEFVSDHFRQFDHGENGNIEAYGSSSPPDYDVENIDVKMFFYHSLADSFAVRKDVLQLSSRLKTLKGRFEIDMYNFDHAAFLYSSSAKNCYKKVLMDVASVE